MGVVGTLLKNRRAGQARLAWNLPSLSGLDTLPVTSAGFADGAAIPPALAPGALSARDPGAGVRVFRSSMGRGYTGPEPIKGHGPHRYVFQVFALATPAVADAAAGARLRPRALLAAVPGPVLGRGRLTGSYER